MSKINALSVPWVLDIRIVSFLVIYLKNNNFSQMANWQNAFFFFFSISFTKRISMVLKIVFLKYILKTLIFKNAFFFKTAYSNIPLLKKSPNLFRKKKKLSLTPLPPSLTCNYPFASTTRQFATPNSCLSWSQTPI